MKNRIKLIMVVVGSAPSHSGVILRNFKENQAIIYTILILSDHAPEFTCNAIKFLPFSINLEGICAGLTGKLASLALV